MNIILFDQANIRDNLKPLSFTRPIGKLRIGILTIEEKWQKYCGHSTSFLVPAYLQKKFKTNYEEDNLYISSHILPSPLLIQEIKDLKSNEALRHCGNVIACRTSQKLNWPFQAPSEFLVKDFDTSIPKLEYLPDLFLNNGGEIITDFELMTTGRSSQPILDKGSIIYNPEKVFLESNVQMRACTINAENGPVYIGENAIIQEGSLIIGPASIGEKAMVAYGAKIRNNTTLGPGTRVGGEVGNSIFLGNANKAHDGFLGNSVIGEWCNLGANTNNSNLKNNYKNVSLYHYPSKKERETGEIFCGVFMGDFTKTGISTMINTGSIFGVSCNIFGAGFQEKFVPSFSWGGKADGYQNYHFQKAIEVINATMARRQTKLSEDEIEILKHINTLDAV